VGASDGIEEVCCDNMGTWSPSLNVKVLNADYCLSYGVLVLSVLALGAIVYMCSRKKVTQDAKDDESSRCGNV
jgi:hypothetical protein